MKHTRGLLFLKKKKQKDFMFPPAPALGAHCNDDVRKYKVLLLPAWRRILLQREDFFLINKFSFYLRFALGLSIECQKFFQAILERKHLGWHGVFEFDQPGNQF